MENYADRPPNDGRPTMAPSPASPPNNANSSRPNGARHSKRLTLNFPINPPPPDVSSPGSMTPVTHSSARQSPALPPDTGSASFDEHDDGNGLLRAIASQERKVLELREELQHAESDLAALKKQWTSSEKTRKRTEINLHAEPLLPLKSPDYPGHRRPQSIAAPPDTPASSSSARQSRDLDRRHSVRSTAPAPAGSTVSANGRRVFQGSHARTLSLLSAASDSASRKPDSLDHARFDSDRIARVPRAATLPSVDRSTTDLPFRTPDTIPKPATAVAAEDIPPQWRNSMPPPSREALMRTGKQMASDLREGLWTFLEDIRQATVGEEGINGTETRGMSSSPGAPAAVRKRDSFNSPSANRLSVHGGGARSSRSSRSSASLHSSRSPNGSRRAGSGSGNEPSSTDIDASFWNEFGIDTPQTDGRSSTPVKGAGRDPSEALSRSADADADAGVDNWDWDQSTPQPPPQPPTTATTTITNSHTPSSSRSTLESKQHSPQTQASSPRTSASFGDWNPALSTIPDPSVSDGIPWPAITKPFPAPKLARTASNLMDEWQRSLSPSPSRSPERKRGSLNMNGTGNRAGSPQLAKDDKKD